MKVSVLVAVYNEEEMIRECLKSLINLDYPKKDFEIVVVNDGSTDNTKENVEEIIRKNKNVKIRLVNQENKGRALAREIGAKEAKYSNILITDARCEIYRDVLKKVKKINYPIIIGNAITDQSSIYGRLNYLIRKPIYKKYNEEEFEPVYINKDNFDDVSKGTTIFFCSKKIFLESQSSDKENKNTNEDIKIFWNIISKKNEILKHSDVKVKYKPRENFSSFVEHIYRRGPRFVNYYFKPGTRYFSLILGFIFFPLILIVSLFISFHLFLLEIGLILTFILLSLIYLSERLYDFFIVLFLLPIIILSFWLGIVKGVIVFRK